MFQIFSASCRTLILTMSVISVCASASSETYGNAIVKEATSIYDADTFRASIAGWPDIVGKRIPIRVKGIDAPELRGKCKTEIEAARQAKQKAVSMIRAAKKIELRNIERDKYFRILADVHLDGVNLGQELVKEGFAKSYSGGTKPMWCPG